MTLIVTPDTQMTLIPFTARLGPKEEEIDARTTAERVLKHFPNAEVDWNRGDQAVYRSIDRLREMGMPDDHIVAKRKSLGRVAYISFQDEQYPGLTGWFYASHIERELGECFDLYSDPEIDIPFLKHLAAEIESKIGFGYWFSTDLTWGITMRSIPTRSEPFELARTWLPEDRYGQLFLRTPQDWKASLMKAVSSWFEQSTGHSQHKMIDRVGSIDAVAADTVDALIQLGEVRAAWVVDIDAPFYNGLIVEHDNWMSYVSLGGAPKGILA